MISCPICSSEEFFLIQDSREYWTVEGVKEGYVELGEMKTVNVHDIVGFWCEDCDKEFSVEQLENTLKGKKDG